MNVTAFLVSMLITLGYYLYTVRKERANCKLGAAADEQGQKNNDFALNPKGRR